MKIPANELFRISEKNLLLRLTRDTTIVTSCLLCSHQVSSQKGPTLNEKTNAPKGANVFRLELTIFRRETKKN